MVRCSSSTTLYNLQLFLSLFCVYITVARIFFLFFIYICSLVPFLFTAFEALLILRSVK